MMLFTWLILDRKTSIHLFPLVTCTKQCCQLGSFLTTGTPCLSLVMLSIPLILITINNGNSGSGKTWGFHHAMVHLKMNQKLTLLEAKSVMLALAPKKGIGEVSHSAEMLPGWSAGFLCIPHCALFQTQRG